MKRSSLSAGMQVVYSTVSSSTGLRTAARLATVLDTGNWKTTEVRTEYRLQSGDTMRLLGERSAVVSAQYRCVVIRLDESREVRLVRPSVLSPVDAVGEAELARAGAGTIDRAALRLRPAELAIAARIVSRRRVADATWRLRAACAAHDPALWFDEHESPDPARALAICRTRCPVRDECLADAMASEPEQRYLIRGGLVAKDRMSLSRRLRRGAVETPAMPVRRGRLGQVLAEDDPRHGSDDGFATGCRCRACRDAHSLAIAARRAATTTAAPRGRYRPISGPDDPRHGSRAGYRAGCRLDCCRAANAAACRRGYTSAPVAVAS